jgi:GT2 family glycosyltransferase
VPPPAPEVSVVIPVRDGAASLPPLLASLDAQTLPRQRFEVVVVDNASSDDTARVAREAGAVVVHEPIANRSRARNLGIATASADVIAFTDADCVASPGWLQTLLACRGQSPLIAGPVEMTTGEPPNLIERFETLWRFSQEAWVRDGWAATANLLAERAALEAVGGFDPGWRHIGEDVDLCLRAGRAGFGLSFCPGATITHDAEADARTMLRRTFVHGYSVNQAYYRLGAGYRAWRRPRPLLDGDRALALLGLQRERFAPAEWRRLRLVGQAAYGARILGSLWAEVKRAR